ncbi:lasso peptide biosynthesis protein [Streptococcus mitis]|uniref:lasso peptide biosynthesis protein n=1 Tax=Streptococcus mitis TaxID=28037 RepID=UPI0021BAF44F|nr:lasso peptide biosynthesis protein [Streptococcus mitis]
MYQKPTITKIGSYRTLTNGAGNGCLQRAVAVMLRGIIDRRTSDWVSAFQVVTFIAHTWLEVDEIPIGEEMIYLNFK